MTKAFSRRAFLLTAAAAAAGAPAFAKPPSRSLLPHLRPAGLNKRAADTAVEVIARARISGKAGYALADAETGKMLESFNPDLALPPASVAKTLTAAYGLGTLGAGYRFATKVIATGGIKGGIV